MASIGLKIMSRKGVAMIEKPNPVLVCKMDAKSIMLINMKIVILTPLSLSL